jgi:hypothetical protein
LHIFENEPKPEVTKRSCKLLQTHEFACMEGLKATSTEIVTRSPSEKKVTDGY